MPIFIRETFINATEGYKIGNTEVYDTCQTTPGPLFRDLQKEHGRCVSKLYLDVKGGGRKAIGWVFHKRRMYTDCDTAYLQETRVDLHKAKPTKTIEYYHLEI